MGGRSTAEAVGVAGSRAHVDAIVPVAGWDIDRFRLLLWPSLERYCDALRTCVVVVADVDLADARAAFPRSPKLEVVPISSIVPEIRLADHPLFRVAARGVGISPGRRKPQLAGSGWRRQQIAKLAFADWSTSDHYLTLDADAFCVRPTAIEDLLPDGRSICEVTDEHPEWYEDAPAILGLPAPTRRHSLMPSLLAVEAVHGLTARIEERSSRWEQWSGRLIDRLGPRLGQVEPWRVSLLWQLPWAEYGLYYTYVESMGLFDQFHVVVPGRTLAGNSVFAADDFDAWDPASSFRADNEYFFSVVQSNKGVDAHVLQERLAPWIQRPGSRGVTA